MACFKPQKSIWVTNRDREREKKKKKKHRRRCMPVPNTLSASFIHKKALHIVAIFALWLVFSKRHFQNTFDCGIINIHSLSFCLCAQFAFDSYHWAIIYVGHIPCVCVCVLVAIWCRPPSDESGHHNDCAASLRTVPLLCIPPHPRQNSSIVPCRRAGKSPLLDRQFRFPTAVHKRANVARRLPSLLFSLLPSLFPFLFFFCLFYNGVWECNHHGRFQMEEDNLEEGERGGAVPGLFIESSARRRRWRRGVGGWTRDGEDTEQSEGIKRHGEGDKDGEQVEEKRLHGRGIDGCSGGMTGGEREHLFHRAVATPMLSFPPGSCYWC